MITFDEQQRVFHLKNKEISIANGITKQRKFINEYLNNDKTYLFYIIVLINNVHVI